ncbi:MULTISPECIES: DUF3488 and transglutaminase-like domain-containing protein [unclassified Arthrobacter]|uniref:transglutaminase TgpA family protein n=1 Tax=unclassified Arthrobacter TaxID=235627 RepID=UPI001E2F5538|nr:MULTISPECIES: DUF3488 and transglutaminase-like domain-containing protein [unclassified Arthrobacter]MCC9146122.1 DUF3488 and transglutaminase-like domain-containing protein [Arthrobacter sp. zg-Y919]MDK1277351.1 DUF3488 and transglutaminase-like domain-containing protein [Arthrobacter sp. zg.Y919]WIB03849.1 DUF3488 and transglutaminase-like domain-containing protein [Arthrobacter sp. zg-Y919]
MSAVLTRPGAAPQEGRLPDQASPPQDGRGAANLGVGAAAAAAVMLCSLSVHGVIAGWSWLVPLLLTVLLPLAATAGARRLRVPQPFVPVAGMAVLACTLTWLFAAQESFLGFLPGPGTLARADALLAEARTVVITEVTPVQPLPGILFLCCAGIGLVAVLTDTLAATLRMPATAGLGLFAVLMIPAVLKPESLGTWYFLLAAAGYLLLLAAGARREQHRAGTRVPRTWLARGTAVSASALALALVLPAVLPGFTGGAFPEGTRFNFWSGSTGLNPVVTLGNDLRQPQSAGRITYATSSDEPVYLRSTTLEDFSGDRWAPDVRADERREGVPQIAQGTGQAPGSRGAPVVTRISSETYSSPWLLAPYFPLGFTGAEGNWSWDPKTMTVLDDESDGAAMQDYQVLSVSAELTPEQLAALPEADRGSVDSVFTDLPEDLPANIREASDDAVGDASTPYAKAMAIQGYLRGPEFSYSLEAPVDGGYDGNGMGVLSEFLEHKAGYCIHFAAAMTVMARNEGIPSRMALGYAPGRSTGQTPVGTGPNGEALREFEVDSTDAHAWPELYFEGAGWVRFEPTPSRGSVPAYALQQRTPSDATIHDDDDPRALDALPSAPAAPQEGPLAPETVLEPGTAGGTAWLGALLGVLAAAGAVLTPWAMRRRRRTVRQRHAAAGPDGPRTGPVWDELADLGTDYGYPGRRSDTPRTYALRLAGEAGLSPRAEEALTRIRRSFEEEAYAGAGRDGRAPAPTWADLQTVREELDRGAGLPARLHARFLPPSLALRFRRE